ncbi:MAG TPA: GspH/FimT family pseudopilin [Methylomirabilota bacterium]|jgi:general secretion pathway protein H
MGQRTKVGARGFTLLELLATLMVLAIALAVVGPAVGRTSETLRTRAEVARFAGLLRHTREQAIVTQQPHSFIVDAAAHRITIQAGDEVKQTRTLPESLGVQGEPPPALTVRFEPQGTCSGGAFRVTWGSISYRITVDGLTGRVRTARL